MSKLLTESRVPKEIMVPKKKIKRIKTREKGQVKYTLIKESSKKTVNELFELYKEDPFKARVKFFNSGRGQYNFTRTVLFEFDGDGFEFAYFQVSFGISITNRIYSSEKKLSSISHSKGKFWFKDNNMHKVIAPLTFSKFKSFLSTAEDIYDDKWGVVNAITATKKDSKIREYFYERFPWIRMLYECPISQGVVFSQVVSKKLYGMNDIYKHLMKVPPKLAKLVAESETFKYLKESTGKSIKPWQESLKILDGVEHLTLELLNDHHFVDTCKMARTLGRKVNCRWGAKRLKEEHDTWAREIGNIVLDCEKEYELSIKPIFKAFADFSGFNLLKTNKEMLLEGMIQNHCVGTYIDQVNRGNSAIYNVEGYTLQLVIKSYDKEVYERILKYEKAQTKIPDSFITINDLTEKIILSLNPECKQYLGNSQFRGKHNKLAPKALVDMVNVKLIQFANDGWFEKVKDIDYKPNLTQTDDVDFGLFNLDDGRPFGDRYDAAEGVGLPMGEIGLGEAEPCALNAMEDVEIDNNAVLRGDGHVGCDQEDEVNIREKVTYDENDLEAMLVNVNQEKGGY